MSGSPKSLDEEVGTVSGSPGPVEAGLYQVRNVGSGLLLEVYEGSGRSGANVQQGRGNGSAGQQWHITPVPNGGGSTTW